MQRDAELFLGWAADAFVAAGRAPEPEQRRNHRRRAELFCDIFHQLNRSDAPAAGDQIGETLIKASGSEDEGPKAS